MSVEKPFCLTLPVVYHFRLNVSPWYYTSGIYMYYKLKLCHQSSPFLARFSSRCNAEETRNKNSVTWRDIYLRISWYTWLSTHPPRVPCMRPVCEVRSRLANLNGNSPNSFYIRALFLRNRFIRAWLCRSTQIAITRLRFTRRETKFSPSVTYIYIIRWSARPSIESTRRAGS